MKKYLISIETDDSPRIQKFYSQSSFVKYSCDFIKFGVVGNKLPVTEYFQLAVAQHVIPLSPGELGCTLSHVKALKDFIQSESDYALIFEDDVIQIDHVDLNAIESEVRSLDLNPCFFISLGGIREKINDRIFGNFFEKKIFDKDVLKLHPFCIGYLSFAFAYLVDKEMARALVKYHQVPKVYDHWNELYTMNNNVSFYAVDLFEHPDIEENKSLLSHLENERVLLSQKHANSKSTMSKIKNSMMKKWLKIFYEKYK